MSEAVRLLDSARSDFSCSQYIDVLKLLTRLIKRIIDRPTDEKMRSINTAQFRAKTAGNLKILSLLTDIGFVEADGRLVLSGTVDVPALSSVLSLVEAKLEEVQKACSQAPQVTEAASSIKTSIREEPRDCDDGRMSYNSEDPLTVSAHLAYHLYRPFVMSLGLTSKLGARLADVKESILIVEKAANRLGVLHATSKSGLAWKPLKEAFEECLKTGTGLSADQWSLVIAFSTEVISALSTKCPQACGLISFLSFAFALLTNLRGRQPISEAHTNQYMEAVILLPNDRLTEIYKQKVEETTDNVLQGATGGTLNVPVLSSCFQFLLVDFISHFQSYAEPSSGSNLARCSTFNASILSPEAARTPRPSQESFPAAFSSALPAESLSTMQPSAQPSPSLGAFGSSFNALDRGSRRLGEGSSNFGIGFGGHNLRGMRFESYDSSSSLLGRPGSIPSGRTSEAPPKKSASDLTLESEKKTDAKDDASDEQGGDELDLDGKNAEELYKILEEFLDSIEADIPTQFKVLKEWLSFAERKILDDACRLLNIDFDVSTSDDEIVRRLREDIDKKEAEGVFLREQELVFGKEKREALAGDEKDEDTTRLEEAGDSDH